jgi:hypothetical protein
VDLGLRYRWICRCRDVGARIGYSMEYYTDALRYPVTGGDDGQVLDDPCNSVGFAGIYFGLDIAY